MCRELKDSGIPWIGEIPASWGVMPHKRVMHKVKEIKEHYNGENILSLTMRGVIVRDLDAGGKMPTTFDGYQKVYPNNLLQCLFDIDVTPRCVGLIKDEGLTSPAYSQFAMYSNGYAPYYDYLLRYMDDRKTLLHLSKNLRSSLTETDFGAVLTCVPSLSEQQRIAEFLDRKCGEVDEMIALQEQIIEELKAYKQSVITEAVTKGLNPAAPMRDSGIEWIGQIPEHWEVKLLSTLFDEHKHKNSELQEANLLSLSYGKIVRKDINTSEGLLPQSFDGYNIISNGDIVFRLTDLQNDKKSLRTGLCLETGIITSAYVTIRARQKLCSAYFHYLVHSYDVCKVFYGMGDGVRQGMNYSDLRKLLLLSPPITEQQAIADYLDEKCADIDSLIQTKQSKIDSLKEYKKSIIYEYVTGKKEVE